MMRGQTPKIFFLELPLVDRRGGGGVEPPAKFSTPFAFYVFTPRGQI